MSDLFNISYKFIIFDDPRKNRKVVYNTNYVDAFVLDGSAIIVITPYTKKTHYLYNWYDTTAIETLVKYNEYLSDEFTCTKMNQYGSEKTLNFYTAKKRSNYKPSDKVDCLSYHTNEGEVFKFDLIFNPNTHLAYLYESESAWKINMTL